VSTVEYRCPRCEALFHLAPWREAEESTPLAACSREGTAEARACPRCHLDLGPGAAPPAPGRPVERCWLCGNGDFYIQKDFNRRLGLTLVVGSALAVFLVMLLAGHLVGIYCLLGIALLDLAAYHLLSNVAVCYLCHSVYRGFPLHPGHAGFYLGLEEKHKKLRQQWLGKVLEGPEGGPEMHSAAPAAARNR
jgi:hypothetical protein